MTTTVGRANAPVTNGHDICLLQQQIEMFFTHLVTASEDVRMVSLTQKLAPNILDDRLAAIVDYRPILAGQYVDSFK